MTTVIVAHPKRLLRESICRSLAMKPGIDVVAEAGDGAEAVRLARALHPDVQIMEEGLPGLNAIDATIEIRRDTPGARVIILLPPSTISLAPAALAAGAAGLVLTESSLDVLVLAIEQVMKRGRFLCPVLADSVLASLAEGAGEGGLGKLLSHRERQILQLVAEGHSTREIASRLHLSPRTVESHRRRIMGKLDLHSLPGLTKYAIREGLTSVEE